MVAGPVVARMSPCSWDHEVRGRPSKAVIRSPAFRPAFFAGEAGSCAAHVVLPALAADWEITHSETLLTIVVCELIPKPMSTPRKRTTARIRFMNGPANITMTRFHGLRV